MADVVDFSVQVNLTGAGPVDVMQQDPPGGPHEVEILDCRQVTSEKEGGKTTLRFALAVIGGIGQGVATGAVIGTDWSKPFNVGHLKNLLLGLHNANGQFPNPEKFNGMVTITPATFKGLRAFIYVKTPPEGEIDEQTGRVKRADKNFITKAMYDAAVKAASLGGTPASAAAPKPTTTNGTAPAPVAAAAAATAAAPAAQGLGDLFS
jgi:hypothetical protein